jgi:UDP-3-O-[3-hydroxymyristoyl] glucosamine N-acyltransferase
MNKILSEIIKFKDENKLVLSHFDPSSNNKTRKLTFCDDLKLASKVNNSEDVIGVVVSKKLSKMIDLKQTWVSDDPRFLFFSIQNLLTDKYLNVPTEIGQNVTISPTAIISPFGVKIDNNVSIGDGVIVNPGTIIGSNSIVNSYCVIGGQGYQFQRSINFENGILKVKHTGYVHIGKNVELKEFCSIHRGLFDWDFTHIGDNSKLDSHCHLGHGAKVGENVFLCSHANLSGNNYVGDNSYIGPGANIPNRISIHSNVKLSVGSTATTDIPNNEHYTGHFAIPHNLFLRNLKSNLK